MIRDNIFTKYDLEKGTPDEIQFEIMEMPQFFHENGEAPKQAHIHGFYQIIWFQHGTGIHYVDFKEYPITDNTLFFISPGQIHYFDESDNQKGIIIHFNESFLSDEGSSENVFLKYSETRSHTDNFGENNVKCLIAKGICRFVPHSSAGGF